MKTDILLVKLDGRVKNGEKLISRTTYSNEEAQVIMEEFKKNYKVGEKHVLRAVPWVERTNLNGGKKFWEPEDTPMYCSPAFDAYWAM